MTDHKPGDGGTAMTKEPGKLVRTDETRSGVYVSKKWFTQVNPMPGSVIRLVNAVNFAHSAEVRAALEEVEGIVEHEVHEKTLDKIRRLKEEWS